MDEVDERRFLSGLPDPGPGDDSRDTDKPGECDRTECVSKDGGERPTGEAERDAGWRKCGSDLLRPRFPDLISIACAMRLR